MSNKIDRTSLRRKALAVRDELDPEVRELGSLAISEHILNHPKTSRSNYIFVYLSFRSEVDTWILTQELLDQGMRVCVPLISGPGRMEARRILNLKSDLQKGPMGIFSPLSITEKVDVRLIDLVLTPGLLFDKKGMRIGYGGGFYDRFLKEVRQNIDVWGLCFDEQVSRQEIERSPWDRPMTGLITPSGYLKTGG